MSSQRTEIINKIWNDLHGDRDPLFYWSDDTETAYYYDENDDTIKSDNGFSVSVDKPTDEINKRYIYDIILKLEGKIVQYYRNELNHELWYI